MSAINDGRWPVARPGLMFACFAAAYFFSQALRSVNAVLAPSLSQEFGLSHAELGALSSAYFLAFALMQMPLGVVLDRMGPRRVNAALLGLAALGCAWFAVASSWLDLWLGRALMGAGVSAALMAALHGFRDRFAEERQGALAAWVLVAGAAGGMAVTLPLEWVLPYLGWRGVFALLAVGLLLTAGALYGWVPPDRRPPDQSQEGLGQSLRGYRFIFASAVFWRMALTAGVAQGGLVAMHSLWVGPWWTTVLGHGRTAIAGQMWLLNAALLAGYGLVGVLARRGGLGPQRMVSVVAVTTWLLIGMEIVIAWADGPYAWCWWLGYVLAGAPYILVQPWLALTYPQAYAGRALTAFNLVIFMAMFMSQWAVGWLVDALMAAAWPPATAFRATLAAMAVLHAGCACVYGVWPARLRAQAPSQCGDN